jgi:hypothetical protein
VYLLAMCGADLAHTIFNNRYGRYTHEVILEGVVLLLALSTLANLLFLILELAIALCGTNFIRKLTMPKFGLKELREQMAQDLRRFADVIAGQETKVEVCLGSRHMILEYGRLTTWLLVGEDRCPVHYCCRHRSSHDRDSK